MRPDCEACVRAEFSAVDIDAWGQAWDHESLHMCSTTMLGMLGDIYLRCVLPFYRYPWRLCKLGHEAGV